ncbi:MAG: hypothetical protein C5B59_14755 [Bacteroidetes bacterium]|nr:MAG: hypothetical protein C5B59_14755 [Bacteroidota bacterium]
MLEASTDKIFFLVSKEFQVLTVACLYYFCARCLVGNERVAQRFCLSRSYQCTSVRRRGLAALLIVAVSISFQAIKAAVTIRSKSSERNSCITNQEGRAIANHRLNRQFQPFASGKCIIDPIQKNPAAVGLNAKFSFVNLYRGDLRRT